MNRLTVLMYIQNAEAPTVADLRDHALKTFAAMLSDNVDNVLDSLLEAQVGAYVEMLDNDGIDVQLASGYEIEKIFRQAALKGFREHFSSAAEDSESYTWWPDFMNVNHVWPVKLTKSFGYMAGLRDGMVAKDLQKYAAAHFGE